MVWELKNANYVLAICFVFTVALFSTEASFAGDNQIEWKSVYTYDSGYVTKRLRPHDNGFDLTIKKSKGQNFWHIQVSSKNPLKISERPYIIEFEANSNKDFSLYSRLGESDVKRGNSYADHSWEIIGDGEWHKYVLDFEGYHRNNYLYFQLGYAPAATIFKIKGITFKTVD